VNGNGTRILLARRASGCDLAVVFEPDALRIEGGFATRRRVAYRSVYGLERAGAWLWLGAGLWPVAIGGRDVPPAQLARVEAVLRERIASLPDGERRTARLAARRAARLHRPWLSAAVAVLLAGALVTRPVGRLALATDGLLLLAVGLLAERWLGRGPLVASGAAGLLAGGLLAPPSLVESARALAAAWIGLVAFARLWREAELSVLARSAFEAAAPLALILCVHAFASGAGLLPLAAATLAGFAAAPLVLRRASH
jgi:hypothetical protein